MGLGAKAFRHDAATNVGRCKLAEEARREIADQSVWSDPAANLQADAGDLTGLFWTKLCEKVSLERSFGHAEEEVQCGADRGAATPD
jgi:hypothetical protein